MIIKNYEQFCILNESVIGFNTDFIRILKEMNSPVANAILSSKFLDINFEPNSIQLSENNDEVLFYPTRSTKFRIEYPGGANGLNSFFTKIGRLLEKLTGNKRDLFILPVGATGEVESVWALEDIKNSDEVNSWQSDDRDFIIQFFGTDPAIAFFIADDGKCSFIRVDYLVPVPTGKPQPLKVGRFAQRFLDSVRQKYPSTPKFTQKEIADFVDEFKAISKLSQGSVSKFLEIVNGNAIAHYYHQDQYTKRRSETLQTSCMKYPECQAYFDVYTQNPQVCSLLIMRSKTEPDKIEGRALVWTLIDGTKFMDRIYYTEQYQVEIFKDYAIKNGWVYKKNQNNKSDEYCLVGPDKVYSGVLAVKLQKWEFELYPYLDTLCYFDDEEKILHNGQDKYKQDYILQQTDGQGGPLTCRNCRGLHYVRCETCFGAGQVWNDDRSPDQPSRIQCPTCEGDGVNRCPECQ